MSAAFKFCADSALLESPEALVVADLTKLKLAHRLGVDWAD